MFNIYVTNLGKYNEGVLLGEWVSLPISYDDFEKVLGRIQVSNDTNKYYDVFGCPYEEIFIADYENDFDYKVDEYENIWDLDEIAEKLENLEEYEAELMEALLDDGYEVDEALNKFDDCRIYYNCSDMEDVAIQYCEECGVLESVPEHLRNYFDFEAFGRDMSFESRFIFTSAGNCVEIIY